MPIGMLHLAKILPRSCQVGKSVTWHAIGWTGVTLPIIIAAGLIANLAAHSVL
jgi:hypothetical protein